MRLVESQSLDLICAHQERVGVDGQGEEVASRQSMRPDGVIPQLARNRSRHSEDEKCE